jgi:hypothetical protein
MEIRFINLWARIKELKYVQFCNLDILLPFYEKVEKIKTKTNTFISLTILNFMIVIRF